jgi:hypothetical protein
MPKPEAPCGTYTAFLRHRRRGEPIDDACDQAREERNEERRRSRGSTRVTFRPEPHETTGLGPRGQEFYEALTVGVQVPAERRALVMEAARMADRLEELNDVIAGKGVLKLMHFRVPHALNPETGVIRVEMSVDHVMGEVRQLQLAFERLARSVFKDIDALRAKSGGESDGFDAFFGGAPNVVGISTAASRKQA